MNGTMLSVLQDSVGELRDHGSDHLIHVATWRWEEVGVLFTFTIFILICGLAKVAFHHARALSTHVPESCLMIVVGITVGAVFYFALEKGKEINFGALEQLVRENLSFPHFTPKAFFFILLPPVILEAAYSLYDRAFLNNANTVMLYAVVGTLFNVFSIGLLLYALFLAGAMGAMSLSLDVPYDLTLTECLVFSTLIAAVDPVAVLAIFQEIGINKDLYYLVFGESLFNDAVTVVLYATMIVFNTMTEIPGGQYGIAVLAFFASSFGGLGIGVVYGLITALITKTTAECRVVEPLAVLGVAYLSYLSAELFHFSGIISIIGCGLVQAHYALKNVSRKSHTTVTYFTKMISGTSEAIIFLFLGVVVVSDDHTWHTGFILWSLVLCFVCRFAGVFLLTAFANIFRVHRINVKEQFILAYGGLRGAIAFSLSQTIDDQVGSKQLFVTTTLVVIFFTVFVQGITIKPLVNLLSIKKASCDKRKMCEEINENLFETITAGIDDILGLGKNCFIGNKLTSLDKNYLQKLFLVQKPESDWNILNKKLFISEHFKRLYGPIKQSDPQRAIVYGDRTYPVSQLYEKSPILLNNMDIALTIAHESESRKRSPSRVSEVFDISRAESLRTSFLYHPHEKFPRYDEDDDDEEEENRNHFLLQRHLTAQLLNGIVDTSPRVTFNNLSVPQITVQDLELPASGK